MNDFFSTLLGWCNDTGIPEQVREVDAWGLFTNPYFLVPFLILIIYLLYRQAFSRLIVIGLAAGIWIFAGSSYMQGVIVNGEVQIDKVLPVLGVGVAVVAVVVYLLFVRSE